MGFFYFIIEIFMICGSILNRKNIVFFSREDTYDQESSFVYEKNVSDRDE